jgi:hypothetical protein
MYTIATQADLISTLSQPLAVVYKHSPICPTSGIADEEMRSPNGSASFTPHLRPSYCEPAFPPGTAPTSISGPR